jgi:ABC-type transport system involved in cytochrome bd biosynthesis fused ATPase/permease subunit
MEVIARFSILRGVSFTIGALALSFLASTLAEEPTISSQFSIALLVYLLAMISQATSTLLGDKAANSKSHLVIESLRTRSAREFLDSSPSQLLEMDIDRIMESMVDRPKVLRKYLARWVPQVAELLISLILALIAIVALLIVDISATLTLTFIALTIVNILWGMYEVLIDSPHVDLSDLEEPSTQDSEDPVSEEVPEATGSLGRIKEIRWTDCEVVLNEDLVVTFPWGIASSGKLTVLTGPGKNAQVALIETIIGIRHPHRGRIFIETGKGTFRIEEFDHSQLRSLISWFPRQPHFMAGTIEENLRLIKPRANREKFKEILAKVGLTEESLPEGLKTLVNPEKMTESQLRRLALARVLLKDAPIVLVEDESMPVDHEFQTLLNETLKNLAREGEVVVCVSDNQDLIKLADRVLTIDSEFFTPTFILENAQ